MVSADVPAKNLKEFIALAKSKPGQLNYGSAGSGSAGHLAFEYLKMVSDLMAASVGAPAILAHIKSGKLRCIATGTKERLAQLPDVPTVAESGYPGFEMTQWYGLNAPANMPQIAPFLSGFQLKRNQPGLSVSDLSVRAEPFDVLRTGSVEASACVSAPTTKLKASGLLNNLGSIQSLLAQITNTYSTRQVSGKKSKSEFGMQTHAEDPHWPPVCVVGRVANELRAQA